MNNYFLTSKVISSFRYRSASSKHVFVITGQSVLMVLLLILDRELLVLNVLIEILHCQGLNLWYGQLC